MDIFNLGEKLLSLLEMVFGFWNSQIDLVFSMLGESPVTFKGGGPWAVIEGIEPIFVAVGSSLVVLFFVIGFCSQSVDVKEDMRFETILRMLIRLGIAEWFVANNVTIMKAFFTSIGNLVSLIASDATVVNMSTYTEHYVNPLDMDVWNLDPNDTKGWIREKGEFMLGLCEQCIGDSLNSRQKSIIDRCVRKLYTDIARSIEKYVPVMTDFYELLLSQPEEEAKDIALSIELFVNGSLNIFNHQTNVDVDNRFTVYGIRDLGTELSPITMLVMMESIQQRIVENGQRGKATWLYIDEFHVLLNSEYSAKYLQQLWKKVRKQGGLCTGIIQNVVDLLQNYTATTMLANSEFVALLKQANTDSSKMAEVIGVSEAQLRFVTNSASGMGLIKCGGVVIPFDNQISKDTSLYKLYNTNIHEKTADQKKNE